MPAISRWKQMQCQIKVVKCNVGGHFENMAAIFEFDGILGGQHFLLDKEGKMYVHTNFHACITICTILVLSRSTIMLGPLCYKLITTVNCYLETGLSCIVHWPKGFTYVHCH